MGVGIAFFMVIMMAISAVNKNSANTYSKMTEPIVVESIYNSGYILRDSVGITIMLDSKKKKWEYLKFFGKGDTIKFPPTKYLIERKKKDKEK